VQELRVERLRGIQLQKQKQRMEQEREREDIRRKWEEQKQFNAAAQAVKRAEEQRCV
jgi:hypothetical protein